MFSFSSFIRIQLTAVANARKLNSSVLVLQSLCLILVFHMLVITMFYHHTSTSTVKY